VSPKTCLRFGPAPAGSRSPATSWVGRTTVRQVGSGIAGRHRRPRHAPDL